MKLNQENEVSYLVNKPVSIFRTYNISVWNNLIPGISMEPTLDRDGASVIFNQSSKTNGVWELKLHIIHRTLTPRYLRGGYDMMMPAATDFSAGLKLMLQKNMLRHLHISIRKPEIIRHHQFAD